MDLFSELISAVQSDMTIGSESTMYPPTTVKLALNRAYRKAGGLFRWPELEDAKKTSTVTDWEYYDYPQNWKPDSIWKLVIDGVDYGDPIAFEDYLYEKENDIPSGATKLWASQWRRFFIYPTPTTTGSENISVWGEKTVSTLAEDGDVTIFSYAMPECNEALVLEASSILKAKGEQEDKSTFRSTEARQILTITYKKIRDNQMKYKKVQPMFDVPDFFGKPRANDRIGNFNN